MFCPNCGKEISEGSNFCQYCGFKIVSEQNLTVEDLIRNVLIQRINGIRNRNAEAIASEVLHEFGSLKNLSGRPLENLLRFRGLWGC